MDLLRHLRFFVAVAEEGHFGHAADRLGMTQPPVSQGVRRLEEKLGVVLLSRGARGVWPTQAGAALLPRARALLADADEFADDAGRWRDSGVALRVGVIPALSDRQVAAIAVAVRGLGAVVPSTASTVELVDRVAAGQVDLAVVHHPALINSLECGPVLKVPRWFLVPADHPAADATSVRALRGLPFAVAPRAHGTAAFDLFVDTLRGKGLDPAFVVAGTDRETVAAVAAGTAFGLTADPDLVAPGVSRLRIAGDEWALRVRLVWREPGPATAVRDAVESVLT